MTITLEIKPEVQAELTHQAAASGRPLEAHAATLLEQAAHLPAAPPRPSLGKSLVEVCAMVSGLTGGLDLTRNPSTWGARWTSRERRFPARHQMSSPRHWKISRILNKTGNLDRFRSLRINYVSTGRIELEDGIGGNVLFRPSKASRHRLSPPKGLCVPTIACKLFITDTLLVKYL